MFIIYLYFIIFNFVYLKYIILFKSMGSARFLKSILCSRLNTEEKYSKNSNIVKYSILF